MTLTAESINKMICIQSANRNTAMPSQRHFTNPTVRDVTINKDVYREKKL